MNIKVIVKPSMSTCRFCLQVQMEYNQIENCSTCEGYKKGIMINTLRSLFDDYATIQYKDGAIENVLLSRVKVINND